ncbi:MAG TPA: methionine/alanine import family NSS transporter small subunit [Clostridia bacterium]|jgi:hypothetical protein|nr:methionine/alanine import family NSS transporter small subunit [Clostridia bacterium]
MNTSALIMFLVGAIMLWGGLIVCLRIAFKKHNNVNNGVDDIAQE